MEGKYPIAVAMSGGVDSSVAAWLLTQAGHPLTGITMRLFGPEALAPGRAEGCGALRDTRDAQNVAHQLGFAHHVLDLSPAFSKAVMDDFVQEYEGGRTPNPCVVCNRRIKFGAMLDQARAMGCDALATGHYARLERDEISGRILLKKATHPEKDQSYVLCGLTQDQLAAARFPLGEMTKDEIRAIALEQGLVSAKKGDSQDICFVPDGDYEAFIRHHGGREYPEGTFLTPQGEVLGTHRGIIGYTLGQRRGLGVSSNHGRLYVTEINPEENTVTLGENQDLFHKSLVADNLNLISVDRLDGPTRMWAKIRYRQTEQPCVVEQTGENTILVTFDQPQRAMTPGQTVALYDGDYVVGGATIVKGAN